MHMCVLPVVCNELSGVPLVKQELVHSARQSTRELFPELSVEKNARYRSGNLVHRAIGKSSSSRCNDREDGRTRRAGVATSVREVLKLSGASPFASS